MTRRHPATQPPLNFDDVFTTQNPDTALCRINSILDRLESLLNNSAIEDVSQSVKERIQALVNRLNGNDLNQTL